MKAQLLGGVQDESSSSANKTNVRSSAGNTATSASSPQRNSQQEGQSYAQSLLARFSQPSARSASAVPPPTTSSAAAGGGGAGFGGIDGAPSGAALYSLLASALQAATAAKSSASSSSTSREAPATTTAPPSLNNPADRAQYAEGLRALLKAFEKQTPATDKDVGSSHVPGTATPPPAGFEAIEHEDAAISEADKPALGKRRTTSGGAWGGWMWGAKKGDGEVKLKETDDGNGAGKSEIK